MTNHTTNQLENVGDELISDESSDNLLLCETEDSPHVLDESDGRDKYDTASKYDDGARKEIRYEAIFLISLLCIVLILLILTWNNILPSFVSTNDVQMITAKKYLYYFLSGILGGTIFGVKYFYRVVARGWWHQDRRVWRLFSPAISGVVAFIMGALIDASFVKSTEITGASIISIGFLAGYFADEAVGKMYEIANVIFGTNNNTRKG